MRIVCPKCELKGNVDAAPTGTRTRIVCVRCASTFESPLANVAEQPSVSESYPVVYSGEKFVENLESDISTVSKEIELSTEAWETPERREELLPDVSLPKVLTPDSEDDFSISSQPSMMEKFEAGHAVEEVQAASPTEENTPAFSPTLMPQDAEIEFPETLPVEAQTPVAAPAMPKSANSRPTSDMYAVGVRLMQVSPLWLLVAGLSFISFIVLCNWIIKPVEQTGEAASLTNVTNNQATNTSPSRPPVPAIHTPAPANPTTQQLTDPKAAFVKAETKEASAPVPTPANTPVTAITASAPEPVTPPVSPVNSTAESKEGRITIQIGSYNETAQAQERVASLQAAGHKAWFVTVEIPKRGTWYRVQSGRFVTRDEAERHGRQLRNEGVVSSFIVTEVQ